MTRLFARLKAANAGDWRGYLEHPFVRALGDGSLPEACFRHYLTQDYLFLLHFARAYALAVYKSEDLEEMRAAGATMDALVNQELSLHVGFCARWGMSEADMAAVPEDPRNMAYTRFVLERGLAGDLLDLLAALAPCVVGYAEIGARLAEQQTGRRDGNPYREWIETYAGADYQAVAAAAVAQLDRVAEKRIGPEPVAGRRFEALAATFGAATRLEIGFWDMGLSPTAT